MHPTTMKRTLLLVGIVCILATLLVVFRSGTTSPRESDIRQIFSRLEKGDLSNASCGSDLIKLLGKPDRKQNLIENEIWSYGPSLSAIKDSKKGDIIGINAYLDKRGSVIRCTGTWKD